MKTYALAGLLSIALATGLTTVALETGIASADTADGECQGPRHEFRDEISHEMESISNGVIITITAENEDAIAHIQERAQNEDRPEREDVEKNVELLDDGVQLTLTSDDEEIVERLQEGKQHGPRGGKRGKGPRGGEQQS